MQKLQFSIEINAPKEIVWDTMLAEESYRVWSSAFGPGSHYIGDWNKGSQILFLAPGESGKMSGMVSRIRENRPHEYVSIEHKGVVQEGKEDMSSAEAKAWSGALEDYTFKAKDGGTELIVDTEVVEGYEQFFQDTWPDALRKLKDLAENQ